MTRAWTVRLGTVAWVAVGMLLVAGPAWADASGPTNYRSQVTRVTPDVDGVTVQVVGGDAFLQVEVRPGHTVTVLGYGQGGGDEEPYLRIDADGIVSVNVNSPAFYLNSDRYARAPVPPNASVDAEPDWAEVAAGGRYLWHDHRIHWMSPGLPRAVERNPGDRVLVQSWTVPMRVDDQPVEVNGELFWLTSRSPLLPVIVAVAAVLVVVALRRASASAAGPIAVGGAGVVATVVAAGSVTAAGAETFDVIVTVLPPVVGLGAALVAWSRAGRARAWTVLVGAAAVLAWALPRVHHTLKPVIPGVLPDLVVTLGIAVSAAAALAAAGAAAAELRATREPAPEGARP